MKKIIIGLFAIGTISAFASECEVVLSATRSDKKFPLIVHETQGELYRSASIINRRVMEETDQMMSYFINSGVCDGIKKSAFKCEIQFDTNWAETRFPKIVRNKKILYNATSPVATSMKETTFILKKFNKLGICK